MFQPRCRSPNRTRPTSRAATESASANAAVGGGGGLLLLLTPPMDHWPAYPDPDKQHYASHPLGADAVAGRFVDRLVGVLRHSPGVQLVAQGERPGAIFVQRTRDSVR